LYPQLLFTRLCDKANTQDSLPLPPSPIGSSRAGIANSDDDVSLIARLRSGDAKALGLLMDRYAVALHRFVRRIVWRDDLADDVVQDVFVSTWERREELVITTSVRGYLYRAARNLALNVVRHEKVEARAQALLTGDMDANGAHGAGSYVQNEGEVALAAKDLDAVVRRALDMLQPQLREVFLLRRMHGLSYDEIATAMGIKVVTVRSQMSRAVRALAQAVEQGWR
jgi:RNA polymerase sigma-70 factor (ECF subfamily)